jgi:hypothetical protein
MVDPLRPEVQSVFPTCDSLEDVVNLGVSRLPITTQNDLVVLLLTYHNTLLNQLEKE